MTAEATWLSYGSALAVLALLQSLVPPEFRPDLVLSRLFRTLFFTFLSRYQDYAIHEYDGHDENELFGSAELYISDIVASHGSSVNLSKTKNASSLLKYGLEESLDAVPDTSFRPEGAADFSAEWTFTRESRQSQSAISSYERRTLHLRVRKKHRRFVKEYLEHVEEKAEEVRKARKERLLYRNLKGGEGYSPVWQAVPFKHPATFQTLALHRSVKQEIIQDLQEFARGKDFYRRAGRAWKRGYLLYGPPGTGKSSMIAAIADLLQYDVYDLDLTEVKTNAAFKNLLLRTADRSVIVIEDIDCTLDLTADRATSRKPEAGSNNNNNQQQQLTLSGLLNFIDGLWSCCGDERIFVFTTNHVDKLDPALIRSGRMDRHICLAYCCFEAVKILINNYLQVDQHPAFEDIRRAIEDENGQITPAEVSEVLTREKRDVDRALQRLVEEIRASKAKREAEQKAKQQ